MNDMKERQIRLKCHYQGEIRSVPITNEWTYSRLKKRLCSDYGFDVSLKYEDQDLDKIMLASQNDFQGLVLMESETINIYITEATSLPEVTLSGRSTGRAQSKSTAAIIPAIIFPSGVDSIGSNEGNNNTMRSLESPKFSSAYSSINSSSILSPKRKSQATPSGGLTSGGRLERLPSLDNNGSNYLKEVPIRWKRGNILGKGAFGVVYEGLNVSTGEIMAVKQLAIDEVSKKTLSSLENEIHFLRSLTHQNIVRYIGTEITTTALSIFLEFAPGGSLKSLIDKFGVLEEPVTKSYTRQLLLGLEYLHRHGIAHRDIKGANCLIASDGIIKLADFGNSKYWRSTALANGDSIQQSTDIKGTPAWMSPEVIQNQGGKISWKKADIWSLACTTLEMCTGRPPWKQFNNSVTILYNIATQNCLPEYPSPASVDLITFLNTCLQRDATKRPDTAQLLFHPFVSTVGAWNTDQQRPSTVSATPTEGGNDQYRDRFNTLTRQGQANSSSYGIMNRRTGSSIEMTSSQHQRRSNNTNQGNTITMRNDDWTPPSSADTAVQAHGDFSLRPDSSDSLPTVSKQDKISSSSLFNIQQQQHNHLLASSLKSSMKLHSNDDRKRVLDPVDQNPEMYHPKDDKCNPPSSTATTQTMHVLSSPDDLNAELFTSPSLSPSIKTNKMMYSFNVNAANIVNEGSSPADTRKRQPRSDINETDTNSFADTESNINTKYTVKSPKVTNKKLFKSPTSKNSKSSGNVLTGSSSNSSSSSKIHKPNSREKPSSREKSVSSRESVSSATKQRTSPFESAVDDDGYEDSDYSLAEGIASYHRDVSALKKKLPSTPGSSSTDQKNNVKKVTTKKERSQSVNSRNSRTQQQTPPQLLPRHQATIKNDTSPVDSDVMDEVDQTFKDINFIDAKLIRKQTIALNDSSHQQLQPHINSISQHNRRFVPLVSDSTEREIRHIREASSAGERAGVAFPYSDTENDIDYEEEEIDEEDGVAMFPRSRKSTQSFGQNSSIHTTGDDSYDDSQMGEALAGIDGSSEVPFNKKNATDHVVHSASSAYRTKSPLMREEEQRHARSVGSMNPKDRAAAWNLPTTHEEGISEMASDNWISSEDPPGSGDSAVGSATDNNKIIIKEKNFTKNGRPIELKAISKSPGRTRGGQSILNSGIKTDEIKQQILQSGGKGAGGVLRGAHRKLEMPVMPFPSSSGSGNSSQSDDAQSTAGNIFPSADSVEPTAASVTRQLIIKTPLRLTHRVALGVDTGDDNSITGGEGNASVGINEGMTPVKTFDRFQAFLDGAAAAAAAAGEEEPNVPLQLTLEGHSNVVTKLRLVDSCSRIISSSHDGTVRIWSADDGTCKSILQCASASVKRRSFTRTDSNNNMLSHNEAGVTESDMASSQKVVNVWADEECERVYAACSDFSVYLMNASTGENERVMAGHTAAITAIEGFASQDSFGSEYLVVTASADKTARVWDRRSQRQQVQLMRGHTDAVTCVSFAENGRVLVTGSKDKTLRIWDIRAGRHRQTLDKHYGAVTNIQAIPESVRASKAAQSPGKVAVENINGLISCGRDPQINCWSKTWDCMASLTAHRGYVTSISKFATLSRGHITHDTAAPGPSILLSCGQDNLIKVWDMNRLKFLAEINTDGKSQLHKAAWFGDRIVSTYTNGDVKMHTYTATLNHTSIEDSGAGFNTSSSSSLAWSCTELGSHQSACTDLISQRHSIVSASKNGKIILWKNVNS